MTVQETYEYILRAVVFLVALVVAFAAMNAFDITKVTRNVPVFFKRLLHFCLVIALAFLIGSFFLAFLPDFSNI